MICARCTHNVDYIYGRLTDDQWDEERCYPHDDPDKTHIVRDLVIEEGIQHGSPRPEALWNAVAALIRAERVPEGIRASHVKSASRALAGGRADW